MNKFLAALGLAACVAAAVPGRAANEPYPAGKDRAPSPGGVTYYIDPAEGSDRQNGLSRQKAWRTFTRINRVRLAPGDRVEIEW